MRERHVAEEPAYKKKQKAAAEHRDIVGRQDEVIKYICSIGEILGRLVDEETARRLQERQTIKRENRTVCALVITALVGAAGVIISHRDTTKALREAHATADQQHIDTLAALEKTNEQVEAMRGQLAEMKAASSDTKRATEATQTMAAAAKRSAELSEGGQRAWVAPTSFKFINLSDIDDPLKVRVTYQNIGREPAKNVKNWRATGFVPLHPIIPPDQWAQLSAWYDAPEVQPKTVCSRADDATKVSVIYPSSTSAMSIVTSKYNVDKQVAARFGIDPNISLPVDDIKSAKAIYFIVGCFSYESLGTARHSSFCAFANPEAGGSIDGWQFSACPIGNDDW